MLCVLVALFACSATASAAEVETTPLRFSVDNVNRSGLACPADGRRYELRGWLTAPKDHDGRSVALYLHEYSFASHFWRFPDDRYDYAAALARAGHASVVIDRLGYGTSPIPEGTATCLGAHADMAAQIVKQLRARGYRRVALAGHSVGAAIAELTYHSFGGVDALALFGWAHNGYTRESLQESFVQGGVCTRGGEAKREGAESGYAYYGQSPENFKALAFHDAEPDVFARMAALRERDPCGDAATLTASVAFDASKAADVKVPVLLVMGEEDKVFEPGTAEEQRDRYTGSDDVTLIEQPRASHALTLERTAPQMRELVAQWFARRGYVSVPRPAATESSPGAAPQRPAAKRRKVTRAQKRASCRRKARRMRSAKRRRAALRRCARVR
jgi:pimeloyl-ACP methyl ester carboxylesterase